MDTGYSTRRATDADRPAIQSLRRAAASQSSRDVSVVVLRTAAEDLEPLVALGRYFVTEHNGRVIAGAGWQPHERIGDTAVIRSMFVHPAHSRCARDIVWAAEKAARVIGYDHILIPAIPEATGFDRRLGDVSAEADEAALDTGRPGEYRRMWKLSA